MKILVIGKYRLVNEVLAESLNCRGIEVKATEMAHQFFAECCHTSTIIFYIDNELFTNLIELAFSINKIKDEHHLKFIAICTSKDLANDCSQLNINFDAMLLSNSGLNDVCFAINEVSRGAKYHVPELKNFETTTKAPSVAHPCMLIKALTKREKEILVQIADSKTTTSIARKLYISTATVNNHKANIMIKLQISGRNTLITTAIALKPWLDSAA